MLISEAGYILPVESSRIICLHKIASVISVYCRCDNIHVLLKNSFKQYLISDGNYINSCFLFLIKIKT